MSVPRWCGAAAAAVSLGGGGEVRERFPAAEQLFHFFQGISKLISSSA